MDLWPAIDIKEGRCVRLLQGDFEQETVFGEPLEVARQLAAAGATRLHLVDLDAARTGRPVNREAVLSIAAETGLQLQAGGGIRDEKSAASLLEAGVQRVIVGTAALSEPSLLARLSDRWPGRIAVGLDYHLERREVAVQGWTEKSGIYLDEALRRLAGLDLAGVIVTDISKDGTGEGPDVVTYGEVLEATELPLLAAGGVGSLQDIARLARLTRSGRRLAGVIVGRALLSGQIALADAERAARRPAE